MGRNPKREQARNAKLADSERLFFYFFLSFNNFTSMAYRHGEGAQKMGMGPSSKDTNQFNQNPVQNQSCFDLSLTVIRSATDY